MADDKDRLAIIAAIAKTELDRVNRLGGWEEIIIRRQQLLLDILKVATMQG